MRLALLALTALALPLTACGGGDDNTIDDRPRETYPSQGIGTTEGAVLANHEFTLPDGEPFTLDEVFFDTQEHLLMLVTASGWCSACIEEQPKLQAIHQEFGDAGLYMLVSVFQDAAFEAATATDAAQWQQRFDLDFTVVADIPFVLGDYYDADLTPMVMLVEVATMEILYIGIGFDESRVRAIIDAKL